MRNRLIELFKEMDENPEITCPHPGDDDLDSCKGCQYAIGKNGWLCDLNARKVDYLLANGVIVPPCKVGDTYYTIQQYCNTDPFETEKEPVMPWDCEKYCGRADCSFKEHRIEEHRFGTVDFILRVENKIGKTIFLTKEEAERALK